MKITVAKKLIEMMNGAAQRETDEHIAFLDFYETLVSAAGKEASKAFGNMSVVVRSDHDAGKRGLELTPADFLYWNERIRNGGDRFARGVSSVKGDIFNRLCKSAESHNLTPEERAAFIDMMKST